MKLIKFLKPLVEKTVLAKLYRYYRDSKPLRKKIIYRKALGFYFNGFADNSDSMEQGWYEPVRTSIFEKVIRQSDLFINIGANSGYYVCRALKNHIDVLAFEPNLLNIKILLHNVITNNFQAKFQLIPVALTDKIGILQLYGDNTGASLIKNWSGQIQSTLTPVSTFDSMFSTLIKDKKCLVLMDMEGSEYNCLKGAESLLINNKQGLFLVEIHVKADQPIKGDINPRLIDTFEIFFKYGFSAYAIDTELHKIELDDIKMVVETGVDTLRSPSNTFIFISNDKSLASFGL
jgi:FkbM family methyltransferase